MPRNDDPVAWMWLQACELIDQAEGLHRRFFRPGVATPLAMAAWEPPVDVFEDEDEIVVVVAMPGVSPDRVQLVSEPGTLVVRGVRPLPFTGSRHALRRLEIPYGAFERRIALPPGTFEMGPPEIHDGCLMLRLRKAGEGWR
jgi:HSP20 family protein